MTSPARACSRAVALGLLALVATAHGQARSGSGSDEAAAAAYSFAVVGTAVDTDRSTSTLIRAIAEAPVRFVVHFDLSAPSDGSCADAAGERRRAMLDASGKPVVPVLAAAAWSDCGTARSDPLERLERIGDLLFGGGESLGRSRLPWVRQSTMPRFARYRENLRWQSGRVLFATFNLPDNNNNFRLGAGRNGEFEERLVANRAWLERTFRIAAERRLAGVVVFVDAAPRFGAPLRTPDTGSRERDGFYEWKVAFREFVSSFKGQVLLVQARRPTGVTTMEPDRPMQDAGGKTIPNLIRIAVDDGVDLRWWRIAVDAKDPAVFRVARERAFDDPSGELYGPTPGR